MTDSQVNKEKPNNSSNPFWNFFKSVKLTLVLLIILAIASIVGTLIPQQDGAVQFARNLNPALANLFVTLDLFDMYHSLWFRIIIALLSINLIICSLDRFPVTLKRFKTRPNPDRSKPFDNMPSSRSISVKDHMEVVAEKVEKQLKSRYGKPSSTRSGSGRYFFAEKGRFSIFGVYFVHLSVLLILIGGIIGSIFGFEAYVNIPERESINSVMQRQSRESKPLGFTVACDKFIVDFYDSGAPKTFQSDVRVLNNGKEVKKASLLVNQPMTYQGITFYQASYGTIPGGNIQLEILNNDNKEVIAVNASKGAALPLPGNEGTYRVAEVEENLRGLMGPAALIVISPFEGKDIQFWIFKDIENIQKRFPPAMLKSPMLNPGAFSPYTFALSNIETKYYTGLQVNKDPGVGFIWAGFIMIVLGLIMTFFSSHKKIWVRVEEDKNRLNISVAGQSNKNPVGLDRELDNLASNLEKIFNR